MMKIKIGSVARKLCAGTAAAAMAASLVPATALADTSVMTGSANRAAEPLVSILGMDVVEGVDPFMDFTDGSISDDAYDNTARIFASGATDADDSHLAGWMTWKANHPTAAQPSAANSASAGITYYSASGLRSKTPTGGAGGPAQGFDGSVDPDKTYLDGMKPDFIVGNSTTNLSTVDTVTTTAGYSGKATTYNATSTANLLASITKAAEEAKNVATSKGKSFRYGDPTDIAAKMSAYVNNMESYLEDLIADSESEVTKPTVAVVTGVSNGTATLATSTEGQGTAAANRYSEAVKNVSVNYADDNGTSIDVADLYDYDETGIDYVLVCGTQASDIGSLEDDDNGLAGSDEEIIDLLFAGSGLTRAAFEDKTFYASSRGAGALYGTVMNSVDNVQNYGRILPFIFPELADDGFTASAALSYYYREFYHVTDEDMLANVMALMLNNDSDGIATGSTNAADLREHQYVASHDDGGIAAVDSDDLQAFKTLLSLS